MSFREDILNQAADMHCAEHIKYPDSSKNTPSSNPQQQNVSRKSSSAPQSSAPNGGTSNVVPNRSMSPNAIGSDSEDPRRAVSPPNAKSIKPSNGVAAQPFSGGVNGKGKAPMRPSRDGEEFAGDESTEGGHESFIRERAISPETQTRAKSPAQFSVASRAVSPANGADGYSGSPNMVGVSMALNGLSGRASPAVDRTKPPADAFHNNPGSPAVNGYQHHHSGSRSGSVSNVTSDLLRDLKTKEVELEGVRRQMSWMKEALAKASRSGYVYVDRDGNEVINTETEDTSDGRYAELALKFKQFRAHIQASIAYLNIIQPLTRTYVDCYGGAGEAGFGTYRGC